MITTEAPVVLREVLGDIITYWHCVPPAWMSCYVVTRQEWRLETDEAGVFYTLLPDPVLGASAGFSLCPSYDGCARHIFAWEAR